MKAGGRRIWRRLAFCSIWLWIDAAPVLAQSAVAGRVVESSAGQAGRRRESEQFARPLARVDSRIQSRIPSRLRQRIDRYYDPRQIDAGTQVTTAQDQARTAGRSARR